MRILSLLVKLFYVPKLVHLQKQIGCKLHFSYIPDQYINGMVSCEMTNTWQRFGIDIKKGQNYFTMGKIENGTSSRFNPDSISYQSWLGGYTVKLNREQSWSVKDHFNLAVADQNSWLKRYGDPNPYTSNEEWDSKEVGPINLGKFSGTLYEGGCSTHSDVGLNPKTFRLYYAMYGMAALLNLINPLLDLRPKAFIPQPNNGKYDNINLKGYIAIFDVKPQVKVVLYANGVILDSRDTFTELKIDLLQAIEAAEIIEQ